MFVGVLIASLALVALTTWAIVEVVGRAVDEEHGPARPLNPTAYATEVGRLEFLQSMLTRTSVNGIPPAVDLFGCEWDSGQRIRASIVATWKLPEEQGGPDFMDILVEELTAAGWFIGRASTSPSTTSRSIRWAEGNWAASGDIEWLPAATSVHIRLSLEGRDPCSSG